VCRAPLELVFTAADVLMLLRANAGHCGSRELIDNTVSLPVDSDTVVGLTPAVRRGRLVARTRTRVHKGRRTECVVAFPSTANQTI
jgi:hypothetical protein